jgi:hypothetical protein
MTNDDLSDRISLLEAEIEHLARLADRLPEDHPDLENRPLGLGAPVSHRNQPKQGGRRKAGDPRLQLRRCGPAHFGLGVQQQRGRLANDWIRGAARRKSSIARTMTDAGISRTG